jgi:predicted transcriptional regulator
VTDPDPLDAFRARRRQADRDRARRRLARDVYEAVDALHTKVLDTIGDDEESPLLAILEDTLARLWENSRESC